MSPCRCSRVGRIYGCGGKSAENWETVNKDGESLPLFLKRRKGGVFIFT